GHQTQNKKLPAATDMKKSKEEHAVAMKKAADQFADEKKTLLAANEVATAAELKKAADTYAADMKKLNADHAAEIKKVTDASGIDKLKEAHAAELKKAADKFADDKKKLLADNDT